MLVLVSFGLVLLATILLVVGLLTDDGLNLIYLSIACSFVAAVVLYLAFRRARPKSAVSSEPPAPLLPDGADAEDFAPAPAPAADPTTVQPAVAVAEPEPEPEPAASVNPGATPTADTQPAVATSTGDDWVDDDDWADAGDFEVEFPIADYDDLTVAEIMPLLPQLYSDELDVVAERERSGKNRSTILRRLEELAATGTEADGVDADEVAAVPAPAAVLADEDEDLDEVAETADEPFAPPAVAARPVPQVPSLSDDDWDDDDLFPIADYDELTADQIIPLLSQLEDDELEDVKAREIAGQGRKSVITELDRQLGLVDAVDDDAGWQADEPADAPSPRPAPVAETPEGSVLAIGGYDGLTVAEIRPLLAGLSAGELRAVLDHEVARDNRRTIVAEIERRLDSAAEEAPAAAA
ncbi:MAG TPA: hypothetical protein VFV42_04075, partial [Acidimicrobiales bacterium]|nr:hypothetical protein [Acidimicrobiales bacterium]